MRSKGHRRWLSSAASDNARCGLAPPILEGIGRIHYLN
jgi:hypothetical protein